MGPQYFRHNGQLKSELFSLSVLVLIIKEADRLQFKKGNWQSSYDQHQLGHKHPRAKTVAPVSSKKKEAVHHHNSTLRGQL